MTKKNLETKNSMDENNETKKAAEGLKAKITENLLGKLGYVGEDAKTNFINDRNKEHPNKKISQTDHKRLLKRVMGEYIRKFLPRLRRDKEDNTITKISSTPNSTENQSEEPKKGKENVDEVVDATENITTITEETREALIDNLEDLTDEEKEELNTLNDLVKTYKINGNTTFEISKETKEKVSTPEKAKQYFEGFLTELQRITSLNNEKIVTAIIVPTLKMYEQLDESIKNDKDVQKVINDIKRESLSYIDRERSEYVEPSID